MMASFGKEIYQWAMNEPILSRDVPTLRWNAPVSIAHEVGTGAAIGPFLTMKYFKQINATYSVSAFDSEEMKEKTQNDRSQKLIEIYDSKKKQDPRADQSSLLQEMVEIAKSDLESRKQREMELKIAPQKERHRKKLSKVQTIHQKFKKCIGNTSWKAIALEVEWRDDDTTHLGRDCAEYKCFLVNEKMIRFIRAPSAFSMKKLKNIALDIKQVLNAFYRGDFLSYSFLDTEDKWENSLQLYATNNLSDDADYWKTLSHEFINDIHCKEFKRLILTSNFRDAFAHRLSMEYSEKDGLLSEIFARVVHDGEPSSHDLFSEEDFRNLARVCFNSFRTNSSNFVGRFETRSLTHLKEDFEGASALFDEMRRKVQSYLNQRTTREFVDEDDIGHSGLTRHEVVRRAILGKISDLQDRANNLVLLDQHRHYYAFQHFLHRRYGYSWLRRDD